LRTLEKRESSASSMGGSFPSALDEPTKTFDAAPPAKDAVVTKTTVDLPEDDLPF